MLHHYLLPAGAVAALLLLAPAAPTQAQAPMLLGVTPAANASAAPRNGGVVAIFSQPLTAASATALKVYSAQRGGLRGGGTATVAGASLSFLPSAYGFRPGEKVQYTVTRAAAGTGGALAVPKVGQFTAAVAGTGRGSFGGGGNALYWGAYTVAVGDVDGDGDLDLVVANYYGNTVTVQLNNGNAGGTSPGYFAALQQVVATGISGRVALADIDADGDLDVVVASYTGSRVCICLNGGNATGSNTGLFGTPYYVSLPGSLRDVVLGDVDGDGDLDLLAANATTNAVNIRLNGGDATGSATGLFSNGTDVPVGITPYGVALGDVDNDGDLDLLATNLGSATVSLRLNGGTATGTNTGIFSGGRELPVGSYPRNLVLGDLDNDGDLDLVVANDGATFVNVCLNAGTATGANIGQFGTTQPVAVSGLLAAVTLGDVDADGDLDLVAGFTNNNAVSVRLNGGPAAGGTLGVFSNGSDVVISDYAADVVLGDLDGDGDLDMITANFNGGSTSVRLNGGTGPLATTAGTAPAALSAYPSPATGRVTLALPPAAIRVELLDALGRAVRTVPAQAGRATLDVAGLSPGLYVVRAAGQVARLLVE